MKKITYYLTLLFWGLASVAEAQYHDATVFEAKGDVKMIIHEIQQSTQRILRNYAFLASGELAATERGDIISIERDEQGRLIKYVYTKRGHYQQHEYDDQGRVSRTSFAAGSETYDYNEKGLIVKMTQNYLSSVSITNYQYLAFDDHDNWTERISESDGEVAREIRTITYWPKTTTGSNESLLTRHQGDQIVLDDRISSEEDDRYIDESYRGLLEYTLRGHQNNYKVILGHTRLSSVNQLPDVGYSDIKSHGDTVTMLKIGNIEDAVSFHSAPSDGNDMLLFIDYAPQVIPVSWKALFDIDGSLYNDPSRKQKLETIGFKLLSEAEQNLFSYSKESYYVGESETDQLIRLDLLIDNEELVAIRISLVADETGRLPLLRNPSAADTEHSAASQSTSTTSSKGGFLQAFENLARTNAKREAQVKQIRELSLQRCSETVQSDTSATAADTKTSAGTATSSTSKALSARTMIDHPFGVLDREITAKQALQQLATHDGWMVELFDNRWIELSSQRGYDLTYEERIPKCNAWFADTEEGRLLSYDYTFSFLFGKDVPDVSPQSALRLQAIHFAQLLASELQHQGIDLQETDRNESKENMFSGTAGNRTIQISIKYCMNDSYEVKLNVILR